MQMLSFYSFTDLDFYGFVGDYLHLDAQINVQGRKKTSGKSITSIQVLLETLLVPLLYKKKKTIILNTIG